MEDPVDFDYGIDFFQTSQKQFNIELSCKAIYFTHQSANLIQKEKILAMKLTDFWMIAIRYAIKLKLALQAFF